jgi:hypothetical protein
MRSLHLPPHDGMLKHVIGSIMDKPDNTTMQFLKDIVAGVSDEELRQKYRLVGKKFYLYKAAAMDYLAKQRAQRADKRKISAKQILADLHAGMDDEGLMIKYNITQRQLQTVLRQIISAGLATPMELSHRLSITKSQVSEAFVEMGTAIKELD